MVDTTALKRIKAM